MFVASPSEFHFLSVEKLKKPLQQRKGCTVKRNIFTYRVLVTFGTRLLDCSLRGEHHFSPVSNFKQYSFIHSVVCLTTGPPPLPKPVLHTVRSSASSFNLRYLLFSSRSSSSSLLLLCRPPVTSTTPSIFPSITCFRRHFLSRL